MNRFAQTLLIFGMLGLVLSTPAEAIAELTPKSKAQMQLSFAPLVKQAAPAVVNIYTRRVVEQVLRSPLFDDPFFRRFFGERFGSPGRKRQQKQTLHSVGCTRPGVCGFVRQKKNLQNVKKMSPNRVF